MDFLRLLTEMVTTGRLQEITKENLDLTAEELQDGILQNLSDLVRGTPP